MDKFNHTCTYFLEYQFQCLFPPLHPSSKSIFLYCVFLESLQITDNFSSSKVRILQYWFFFSAWRLWLTNVHISFIMAFCKLITHFFLLLNRNHLCGSPWRQRTVEFSGTKLTGGFVGTQTGSSGKTARGLNHWDTSQPLHLRSKKDLFYFFCVLCMWINVMRVLMTLKRVLDPWELE